jgi:hypothetical protein
MMCARRAARMYCNVTMPMNAEDLMMQIIATIMARLNATR